MRDQRPAGLQLPACSAAAGWERGGARRGALQAGSCSPARGPPPGGEALHAGIGSPLGERRFVRG